MENSQKLKFILGGVVSGVALSYIFTKIKNIFSSTKTKNEILQEERHQDEIDLETQKRLLEDKKEQELVREQLKRNYEFFGEEGMKQIENAFVVVVGIGGVGR
jgi:hypothetical protein